VNLRLLLGLGALPFFVLACEQQDPASDTEDRERTEVESTDADINPLLEESNLPYGMPPFDRIESEHFEPALEKGMEEQMAEIEAIAHNPEPVTFNNTIVEMEPSTIRLLRWSVPVRPWPM